MPNSIDTDEAGTCKDRPEKWKLETRGESFQPDSESFFFQVEATLYRQTGGAWVLVEQQFHSDTGLSYSKTFTMLTPAAAAERLLLEGYALPDDLVQFLPRPEVPSTDPPPVALLHWDDADGNFHAVDVTHAMKWKAEPWDKDFDFYDGAPDFTVQETLYRAPDGLWVLETVTYQNVCDRAPPLEDYSLPSDQEAAVWLLRHKHKPPEDLIHLAEHLFLKAGSLDGEGQTPGPRARLADLELMEAPAERPRAKRITVEEANVKAMKLAHKMRAGFFALSERQQAKHIGCSWKTWTKTPFYGEAQTKRPGGKQPKLSSSKTESLTAGRERVTGEGEREEVLQQLIADQKADKEPSPLETDPPDRLRRIHSRKRL